MVGKIYLVTEEYNNNGEVTFDSFPCVNLIVANRVMQERKEKLFNENGHWHNYECANVLIEQDETSFFVRDVFDDYYCLLNIIEKDMIE